MLDNNEIEEKKSKEPQDLEHQQEDIFRELSQEQTETEKDVERDQERLAKGKLQDESDN